MEEEEGHEEEKKIKKTDWYGETTNTLKVFVLKPHGRTPLGIPT
jgi:hypothetical protein